MTQKERLATMEQFFWRLNFHRTVTMNEKAVFKMLEMADRWVGAHSDGNGERSEKDISKNVDKAYEDLKVLP